MQILIGVNPDDSGTDALALGAVLCRSLGATPVLAHVHPAAYDYTSRGHVDVEWESFLSDRAQVVLDEARERLGTQFGFPDAPTEIGAHRSSGRGLASLARRLGADIVVIGSGPGAQESRIGVGSTANQLMHGSPVPVAIAPSGYRRSDIERLGRVVVAFQDTKESRAVLAEGLRAAERSHCSLRVLTVLIRHSMYGLRGRREDDNEVLERMRADSADKQALALADIATTAPTDTVTLVGDSVQHALNKANWHGEDLLILSSARGGAISHVFLGDMTYKLLRASTVPAVVLPRRT